MDCGWGLSLTSCSLCIQLMSKETPVTGGNDSYVDLDRQVWSPWGTGGRVQVILKRLSIDLSACVCVYVLSAEEDGGGAERRIGGQRRNLTALSRARHAGGSTQTSCIWVSWRGQYRMVLTKVVTCPVIVTVFWLIRSLSYIAAACRAELSNVWLILIVRFKTVFDPVDWNA